MITAIGHLNKAHHSVNLIARKGGDVKIYISMGSTIDYKNIRGKS